MKEEILGYLTTKYAASGLAASEIEGISLFNNRVYISLYERYNNGDRRTKVILVNGF